VSAQATSRGPRQSAAERREAIVGIALEHFGQSGLHGTSTEAIAREAGISQPYLFRLFGTKKELFLACCERSSQRVRDAFERAAAAAPPGQAMPAMGQAYRALLQDRRELLCQMQSYAACADPEIRAAVRHNYGRLVELVGRLSGAAEHEVWQFCAKGMLLNVVASLDLLADAGEEPWTRPWTDPSDLLARMA